MLEAVKVVLAVGDDGGDPLTAACGNTSADCGGRKRATEGQALIPWVARCWHIAGLRGGGTRADGAHRPESGVLEGLRRVYVREHLPEGEAFERGMRSRFGPQEGYLNSNHKG